MKYFSVLMISSLLLCNANPSVGVALSSNSMWKGISITKFELTGYYQTNNTYYYGSIDNAGSIRGIGLGMKHFIKNHKTRSPFFAFSFNSISEIQSYSDNIRYVGPSGEIGYSIPFKTEINDRSLGFRLKNASIIFNVGTGYMILLNRDAIGEQFYFFRTEFKTDHKIIK